MLFAKMVLFFMVLFKFSVYAAELSLVVGFPPDEQRYIGNISTGAVLCITDPMQRVDAKKDAYYYDKNCLHPGDWANRNEEKFFKLYIDFWKKSQNQIAQYITKELEGAVFKKEHFIDNFELLKESHCHYGVNEAFLVKIFERYRTIFINEKKNEKELKEAVEKMITVLSVLYDFFKNNRSDLESLCPSFTVPEPFTRLGVGCIRAACKRNIIQSYETHVCQDMFKSTFSLKDEELLIKKYMTLINRLRYVISLTTLLLTLYTFYSSSHNRAYCAAVCGLSLWLNAVFCL